MIDDVFKYPDDSVEGGTAGEALLMIQRGGHRRSRCWMYLLLLMDGTSFFPFLRGLLASTVILCLKLETPDEGVKYLDKIQK
jgi:hypothetical protein